MRTAERIIVEESDDDTDIKENRKTVGEGAQLLHHCISETQFQGLHPLGAQLASFQRPQPAAVMQAARVISPPTDFTRHQPPVIAVTSSSFASTTGSPRRGKSGPSDARLGDWIWMPNAKHRCRSPEFAEKWRTRCSETGFAIYILASFAWSALGANNVLPS